MIDVLSPQDVVDLVSGLANHNAAMPVSDDYLRACYDMAKTIAQQLGVSDYFVAAAARDELRQRAFQRTPAAQFIMPPGEM